MLSPSSGSGSGRAIVIGPYLRASPPGPEASRDEHAQRSPQARLDEAVGLARAIDLDVVHAGVVTLAAVRPATYLGKGKVEEIAGLVKTLEAGLV
ncbi:MAG: GTPase HflX, partial [Bradyrhizobiaceae bacterium]|nr:GTPase HflX [Bradyrhizobiaceae bacterium]